MVCVVHIFVPGPQVADVKSTYNISKLPRGSSKREAVSATEDFPNVLWAIRKLMFSWFAHLKPSMCSAWEGKHTLHKYPGSV